MDLEERLAQMELLIERTENGEYLEQDLSPIVLDAMKAAQTASPESQTRCKDLFLRIAATHKSTFFGCNFYRELERSDFPFTKEVFERAVYTESYYNCKADAIAGYFVSVLKNNGFKTENLFSWLIETGHYREPDLHIKKNDILYDDYEGVKKAIKHALQVDQSYFMGFAALRGADLFKTVELSDLLEGELKQGISEISRMDDAVKSNYKYDYISVAILSRTAFVLYQLTKDERYKKVNELLDEESFTLMRVGVKDRDDIRAKYFDVHNQIIALLQKE